MSRFVGEIGELVERFKEKGNISLKTFKSELDEIINDFENDGFCDGCGEREYNCLCEHYCDKCGNYDCICDDVCQACLEIDCDGCEDDPNIDYTSPLEDEDVAVNLDGTYK